MDQMYPFNIAKEEAYVVNPRTGLPGVMELHAIYGEVFLFKGTLTDAETEEQIKFRPVPGWHLACNPNVPGIVVWDGNQNQFTIGTYSGGGAAGYVRISEIVCGEK